MSVERKCDCGAMMGAYDLGCKICGKSFKVRDEFLVGKDILPEPPVGMWAAQQREAASKKKSWTRKPAPRRTTPQSGSSTSVKYNFSTVLLLAISFIAVILFREQLITETEALPYAILAVTLLISFIALRNNDFFENIVMSPTHVFHNKEYYRLISSGFGHINAGHFILNAIGLINFGPFLMDFLVDAYDSNAPLAFLLIYISAIVVADLPDLIRHRHNPEYTSVGASGAISAVVAGAAISYPNLEVILFFIPGLELPGFVYAIGYLAISIFLDYRGNGRVAHLAHAAGTIYGLAVVAIISSIFTLGFASSSSSILNFNQNPESSSTQSESTDSNSLVDLLNSAGPDAWESQSQDVVNSLGASEVIFSGDCWVLTYSDAQQLTTRVVDSWDTFEWDIPTPEYWYLNNQAIIGPSATSSCVVTAAKVLNWDLS